MFTRIVVNALALTALGAGAFAFAPTNQTYADPTSTQITIMEKNQIWPVKGRITMDPCAETACQEV
jgi:hypothetical protein